MKPSPSFLSVVVPSFNEELAIGSVLRKTEEALKRLPCASEIIVVDDASEDDTAQLVSTFDGVRLLTNPVNLGYGHSLLRGIAVARGDVIAICDADGTYDPAGIPELYAELEAGADQVIGRRTGTGLRRLRLLRTLYRWLCGYVVGTHVPDANSGLRVFRTELARNLRADLCRGFSFTTSLTLASLMRGYVVSHRDIPYSHRVGRSHVRVRDVFRTAQYLFQLIAFYNPLKLFLPIVAVSVVASAAGFLRAALAGGIGAYVTGVTMAATTLVLIALAAQAYIVSRSSMGMGRRSEPWLQREPGDQPGAVNEE